LHQDDETLQTYRREHGLVRGQTAPITSESLTATALHLATAQAAKAEAFARLLEMSSEQNPGAIANARPVLESRTISDLKSQLSSISAQLAARSANLMPDNPVLNPLRMQKAEVQAQINRETQRIAASVKQTYNAAAAEVDSIATQFEDLKASVSTATAAEASISNMVREAEIKRELYVDLVKKANLLETERRILTGNVRLVNYAELPTIPWFPKRLPFAAAAFVLAAGAAAAAVLLSGAVNQRIRSTEGMTWLAGARVIGQLPGKRGRRSSRQLLQVLNLIQQPTVLQEAARALYAQIRLSFPDRPPRTLLVTSFNPAEGKTFSVFALGGFVASTGQRVLAIECDLRNPGFGAFVPPGSGPGLDDYLGGRATFPEVVSPTGINGLDVIRVTQPNIASTELLSGARMRELLQQANIAYDLVLLDSPPSGLLMDAHVLCRQVDGVLFCARWGETRIETLSKGVRALQEVGGCVVGIALTMCREGDFTLYKTMRWKTRQYRLAHRPT
jgi:succinoglycan biosynthesis transport protein ExoP